MKTICNLNVQPDPVDMPLFFGEDLCLQRYDRHRYKKIYDLFQAQVKNFWRPEEIEISRDRGHFLSLTEGQQFIFTSNLKYQTMLDSVIGRGIDLFKQRVTNPDLEAVMNTWCYFETIHSYSYTYVIQNVYNDKTSKIFDEIMQDKAVMKRAKSVCEDFDKMIGGCKDEKSALYRALISTQIMEGVRFYVSFACAYAFPSILEKMEGNAKIIKLINRDENVHVTITKDIINILKENESEGFTDVVKKNEDAVCEMFRAGAEEEKEWARHLFKHESMIGLNADMLCEYVDFLTYQRMKGIGIDPITDVKHNPINFISSWSDSEAIQVAPQETEVEAYLKGEVKSDLGDTEFGDF